jgi:transposase-like protein
MTDSNTEFDFQKALKGIHGEKSLTGKDYDLTSIIKDLSEAALEAELDWYLGQEVSGNRRNGNTSKTIKFLIGNFQPEPPPQDQDNIFPSKIVKKNQTTLSEITDKIIHTLKEWQARPLENVYRIVWPNAIHLQILAYFSNRVVNDILIACVDDLKGFPEANDKYPILIKPCSNDLELLSQHLKYAEDIRRIIYTKTIEAVHRQFRKLTMNKRALPNQVSLLKPFYMGICNGSKRWTMPIQKWTLTFSQLTIFFEGRLDKELRG